MSTTEVEGIVSSILDLKTTTAYGVKIPNMDGRAGMVAIVVENESEIDFDRLRKGVVEQLPNYARPLFVRLLKDAIMTSKIILLMYKKSAFQMSYLHFRHIQTAEESVTRGGVQSSQDQGPDVLSRHQSRLIRETGRGVVPEYSVGSRQAVICFSEAEGHSELKMHFIHVGELGVGGMALPCVFLPGTQLGLSTIC